MSTLVAMLGVVVLVVLGVALVGYWLARRRPSHHRVTNRSRRARSVYATVAARAD